MPRYNALPTIVTAFRVVEADRLCNPDFCMDRDDLRRGIHINPETGAPIGYWICSRHPGDRLGLLANGVKRKWTYISAFTSWGRRRVIHVFPRRRPEQSTGISALAGVADKVRDIGKITRAELRNQVVTAALSLIVESNLQPEQVMQMFKSSPDYGYLQMYFDEEFRASVTDDGATIVTPPGTKVSPLQSNRNAQNFEIFLKSAWREVMTGIGVPYEVGARDFGGLNYSNARTIITDAWQDFYTRRTWLSKPADPARARMKAITSSASAKLFPTLASHIAYDTDLSAEDAEAVLEAALQDVDTSAAAEPEKPSASSPKGEAFRKAMQNEASHPSLGTGASAGEGEAADPWLAAAKKLGVA